MVGIVSVTDGPATTVNDLVGAPMVIPRRIISLLANQWVEEVLLRDAGANTNGMVSYGESTPLYLDAEVEKVAEFGEIPVGAGQIGLPRIAVGTKEGLGVRVSKEMRDENKVDDVNRQVTQVTNTMLRAGHRALRALLENPAIPTIAAGAAWDTANGRPRRDLANAQEVIAAARPAGTLADDSNFEFEADTVVLPGQITPILMDNENFLAVYKDGLSTEDIRYTGKLPREIMGMLGLRARGFASNKVLVVERGTVGFRSDTRPLQATGLYPEGGGPNGGPTESWRSDVTRKRVLGIDQPLAACWISGVVTP